MKRLEKLYKLKKHPTNPRIIKDNKFNKLVKSLKDFPEMLEQRPLIVNSKLEVLGGNMRLSAANDAGLKEIWIDEVDWSEERQKEFMIKDNSSYGEWDWDLLANEWDNNALNDWGLDIPKIYFDEDKEPELDKDMFAEDLDTYINAKVKQIVLYFKSDEYQSVLDILEIIREKENLQDNTQVFKFLIKNYGV